MTAILSVVIKIILCSLSVIKKLVEKERVSDILVIFAKKYIAYEL